MPFDKSRIFPYTYRSYAQRHADAGVQVDVLRELMDHLHLVTSQSASVKTVAALRSTPSPR
ncbi:hypothetical protein ACQP2U_32995 [Nocardia sp. CA-084685]|uniref:hypothetical protein n=1 Tax=Nocardia sp. CA-084685 TaxID=3239970 RepID=UPI003D97D605